MAVVRRFKNSIPWRKGAAGGGGDTGLYQTALHARDRRNARMIQWTACFLQQEDDSSEVPLFVTKNCVKGGKTRPEDLARVEMPTNGTQSARESRDKIGSGLLGRSLGKGRGMQVDLCLRHHKTRSS
jgi:hypothetical protein